MGLRQWLAPQSTERILPGEGKSATHLASAAGRGSHLARVPFTCWSFCGPSLKRALQSRILVALAAHRHADGGGIGDRRSGDAPSAWAWPAQVDAQVSGPNVPVIARQRTTRHARALQPQSAQAGNGSRAALQVSAERAVKVIVWHEPAEDGHASRVIRSARTARAPHG